MTLIALVGILVFAACASGQQQSFADYDYQGQALAPSPRPSQSVGLSRAAAAAAVKPTPVPIIKQINRHNDDGSYTYGYEGADGSFKIETKLPTGEVSGKYGYVDDTGKLRVVDYGANRYGFQPAGDGITVAPPTLVDETTDKNNKENGFAEYDDEGVLYSRAQPQPQPQPAPAPRPIARQPKRPRPAQPRPQVEYAPQPQYVTYEPQQRAPAPAPAQIQHIPQQIQQIPQQIPQPVQPQYPQYITYEGQPRGVAPAPRVAPAPAPAPPRAIVPGALPAGPLFRPNALPSPIAAPAQPSPLAHAPVQVRPAPVQVRPAPVRETPLRVAPQHQGSVLDQLIQQFALPQGVGQPLHDISFGSYSSQPRF